MNAQTFINKNLHFGDKVRLTMYGIKEPIICFFGGYKTFGNIETNLDYGIFPVFYRVGKNGRLLRRSVFGYTHLTWAGLSEIEDVEREVVYYKHLGYYNNWDDCFNLGIRGPKAILKAWKDNDGDFYEVDNDELFDDVVSDDQTTILEDGKYAVRISGCDPIDITEEDIAADGECYCYLDIFERVEHPENF